MRVYGARRPGSAARDGALVILHHERHDWFLPLEFADGACRPPFCWLTRVYLLTSMDVLRECLRDWPPMAADDLLRTAAPFVDGSELLCHRIRDELRAP